MILQGQGAAAARGRVSEQGYAMAGLLVGLSVMAVLMSAMLPVWSHMVQREKEEELIFRGNQYARAIGLFQRKFANTAPPTLSGDPERAARPTPRAAGRSRAVASPSPREVSRWWGSPCSC